MRIALFHNLPSGGAKRHTYEQVRELARRGHEIVEFAPTTADIAFCSFAPYVKEQRVFALSPVQQTRRRVPLLTPYLHAVQGIQTLQRAEQVNRAIARAIDAQPFDVVLAKDCHIIMNPYVLRYLRTRSVFQCHHGLRHRVEASNAANGSHPPRAQRIKDLYYAPARALYERTFLADETNNIQSASSVLTNSEYSRQLLAKQYQVQARVIYPGINTDTFRPLPVAKRDYVLCVGALIYSKGYRFLITALSRLDDERRPALFIAANSADPDEETAVRQMAATLGVTLHIERITDDRRLVEVYNQAKVFVYAPMQEALGMAPLEAAACGVPSVAVAEGGVRETIVDGETGLLVPRDAAVFANHLQHLLDDDQTRARLGEAALANVRQNWTWSRAVDRLERELTLTKERA